MGLPTIWWYPDSTGTIQQDTLAESLSQAHDLPYWDRADDAVALSGSCTRQPIRAGLRVHITCENFSDEGMVSNLFNVLDHLRRGRHIGFATDADKAWCSYTTKLPKRGDTTLTTGGNAWWTAGSGSIADDEYLIMETGNPGATRQRLKKSTPAGSTATSLGIDAPGVIVSPGAGPCWVRSELFWPLLYLPSDQLGRPLLTSNWRKLWTLDMELELDLAMMARLENFNAGFMNLSAVPYSGTKGTLEENIGRMDALANSPDARTAFAASIHSFKNKLL